MALAASPAQARELDPDDPVDALEIAKRVQCGVADGVPAVYHWSGKVYGRRAGEPDKHLFNGEGMNIRQCMTVTDPVRGTGWRMVSREIMLYLDPDTNEVVRTWENPYTGETVKVMQIANDPVNQRPSFAFDAQDNPSRRMNLIRQGDWIFMPLEVPLFYHNVLAGDYQDYVGNKYHAMEIFDFAFDAEEMLDTDNPTAYPIVSWVRISAWMPWMKMRGRDGQVVFNAMGAKLDGYDDLPDVLKDEIALNYPEYAAPRRRTTPVPMKRPGPCSRVWSIRAGTTSPGRARAAAATDPFRRSRCEGRVRKPALLLYREIPSVHATGLTFPR